MLTKYSIQIKAKEKLLESQANFNDMGIMQALDNITAVSYIIKILTDNQLKFNANKVILYGHSHGAFLSYLCNAFAPGMFSLLIDNSSWLFPAYLQGSRHLFNQLGNMIIDIEFDYLASHMPYDNEMLYLPVLYSKFKNHCEIECFHGTTDNLISHMDKKNFSDQVDHCFFHEISPDRIDNHIFKSTNHGLDADFLKMFDFVMNKKEFEQGSELSLSPVTFETSTMSYNFNYDSGVPLLSLM